MTAPADASYFREDVLAGRVALVTGGGSGIGFEVARQFGRHGCAGVVLVGRRPEFLQQASALLAGEGIRVATAAGDVRKPEDCENAVKVATETFGGLDILVNAAAGNFLAAAEEISSKGFKTVMDIDILGTFNMCRSAFEPLKSSRFGGVVVSITATLHYTSTWYQAAPVAAKAAIDALTRTLALEWGEYGVRCNCVAPGPIADTPGMEKLSGGKMDKNLPMVGAAGVLALPMRRQLAEQAPEKPAKKSARLVGADASDLLAAGELHGWGGDYEDVPPYQQYDVSKAERKFKRYVEEATKAPGIEWVPEDGVDLDQVRVLTMGQPDPKPVQGPGILQLAKDPARREECPVCNAEWAQALRCMSEGRPPPAREAPSPQMARKQSTGQRRNHSQKMHSVQCTFHWFQQNLCALLCNLRFDSRGAPRPSPPTPGAVLPPPMLDVLQYWKKSGGHRDRPPRLGPSQD